MAGKDTTDSRNPMDLKQDKLKNKTKQNTNTKTYHRQTIENQQEVTFYAASQEI